MTLQWVLDMQTQIAEDAICTAPRDRTICHTEATKPCTTDMIVLQCGALLPPYVPDTTTASAHQFLRGVLPNKHHTLHLPLRAVSRDFTFNRTLKAFSHPQAAVDVLRTLKVDTLFWEKENVRGEGVKVAIFDTGIAQKHRHFNGASIPLCVDYTASKTCEDGFGHGTFVAGLVGSQNDCLGLSPRADIYVFKVFTDQQVSYTSWFIDAFNHAIDLEVDVLNLSIGGPDYMDRPFTDKVREAVANGISVISAIGNDGPTYGTVNNPADMLEVIGVGAATRSKRVASFSSRGMTTWELPQGYGRPKPDLLTYGENLRSVLSTGGCTELSGSSVASPAVAAVSAQVVSYLKKKSLKVNPALLKKILTSASLLLPKTSIYEQGAGLLAVPEVIPFINKCLEKGEDRLYDPVFLPATLRLYDCDVFSPLCHHSVYYTAVPVVVNLTVINPTSLVSRIVKTSWELDEVTFCESSVPRPHPLRETPPPGNASTTTSAGNDIERRFFEDELEVSVDGPPTIYPYFGWSSFALSINDDITKLLKLRNKPTSSFSSLSYIVSGTLTSVLEVSGGGAEESKRYEFSCEISVRVIARPKAETRVLWDVYHSLQYPPVYVARDDLVRRSDVLDWNGDHPHTNFLDAFLHISALGYHVDLLSDPFTSFDAALYKTLLLADPEEEFSEDEKSKLKHDVLKKGLSVVIFADWYNEALMKEANFVDENTKELWMPVVGGANIPAINDLLEPFDIALSSSVWEGTARISDALEVVYKTGASLLSFPTGGQVFFSTTPLNDMVQASTLRKKSKKNYGKRVMVKNVPILGITDYHSGARIAVFGDSGCIDSSHLGGNFCGDLLQSLLLWGSTGQYSELLKTSPSIALHQDARLSGAPWEDPVGERPNRTPRIKSISHALHGANDRRGDAHDALQIAGVARHTPRKLGLPFVSAKPQKEEKKKKKNDEEGVPKAKTVPLSGIPVEKGGKHSVKRRRTWEDEEDAGEFAQRATPGSHAPLPYLNSGDDVVTVPVSHTVIMLYYRWYLIALVLIIIFAVRFVCPKRRRGGRRLGGWTKRSTLPL